MSNSRYLGMGTDLLSFGEYLITNEEEDDCYSCYDEEEKNTMPGWFLILVFVGKWEMILVEMWV
ncbi:hypothetical protein [Marinifilum sp.]|uniref:hypothetical protein n=1 Tax=Marinifilum sp. TaxID=2033137 RepID=UPI003BA921E6